ncbi:MAG: response regulator [Chloroflexi bacterium]|nr:response regulator [Chloroflexota bacterium]
MDKFLQTKHFKRLWKQAKSVPEPFLCGQISQVVKNLVINAVQAMSESGHLHISGENVHLPPDHALAGLLAERNYVRLSVQDNGQGIALQNLTKIFDPYFTTKEQGSGLGLAVCYSVIKKHDGLITVESTVGSGTTFQVYLPATYVETEETPRSEAETSLKSDKGRLLIMDDEPSLRRAMQRLITRLGYQVEVAEDGQKAIEIYQKARAIGQPFDLVLLDLMVPGGMGGKETIAQLRELDPQVKAIVSSGYSNDPVMANYTEYGFLGVLPKPYTLEELRYLINKWG